MTRDPNIIVEDLNDAKKQSNKLYIALIDLGGEMATDSRQYTTFTQLLHELTAVNGTVKALENEFMQVGNSKW